MTVKADQDVYALHNDETFLQRLTVAVVSIASAIFTEPDATKDHERRLIWARKAAADPRAIAAGVAWAALGDATIQAKAAAPDTLTSLELQTALGTVVAALVAPVSVASRDVDASPLASTAARV